MKRSAIIAAGTAVALAFAVLAGVSVAPSFAASGEHDRQQCFDPAWVRNFQTDSDHKVIIVSERNQAYELTLGGVCIGLDTSFRLGFRQRRGASQVCGPFDADVVWDDMGELKSCPITAMRHLTGDEAKPYVRPERGSGRDNDNRDRDDRTSDTRGSQ